MASKKYKINCIGFQSIGYQIENGKEVSTDSCEIQFFSLKASPPLDEFDGIIIPSGIFESFEHVSNYMDSYTKVYCERDLLLKRERELINLFKKQGWICCLVREIFDNVSDGSYRTKSCNDTDLTKILLNSFNISRKTFKGSAAVDSKNDEFNNYIKKWGIAKTVLTPPYREQDRKVIAQIGDSVVGLEFMGKVFFLPFHATDYNENDSIGLGEETSRAILAYRQKRITEIPDWAQKFQFDSEIKLQIKLNDMLKEVNEIQNEISEWQSYKGILSQSGDSLKDSLVFILKSFFKLNVTDVEDFKEDAVIRSENGEPIVIVEVKGTKGGIKRKYINQLDTNRERIGVDSSTPGLLLINDQMTIENIESRRETTVADEQISHSKNCNILIIRTVDFISLMKNFENDDSRGDVLIELCSRGGGLLIVEGTKIDIAT